MKFCRCQDLAFVSFQLNFHGIRIKDTYLTAISVSSCNDIRSTLEDVKENNVTNLVNGTVYQNTLPGVLRSFRVVEPIFRRYLKQCLF